MRKSFEQVSWIAGWSLYLVSASALAAAADPSVSNYYIPADKTPWYEESPGMPVKLARLWGDRVNGEAGTLLNVPAGFKTGPHSHTADYWAVVVAGTWAHWVPSTGEGRGLRLEPGAHWVQIKTQLHEDACISSSPCTIFLFNKQPYTTEFPESPASLTLRPEVMEWHRQSPDMPAMISMLWGSRDLDGGFGELVKVPPGFDSGLHAHTGEYHGVLVQGTWVHVDDHGAGSDTKLEPGSYIRQAGGGMHIDRCVSRQPCVIFLFQSVKADVIWPAKQK